ncbi:MAG: hypothetical protein HYY04_17605 [Chloroflexi bacterium]|nr:hypothetical protein [Chloroflexota bacterium]
MGPSETMPDTRRKMIENLWHAAGYNIFAFPIAGGTFYSRIGLLLWPEIAAFTMAGSSVLVTVNALLAAVFRGLVEGPTRSPATERV